MFMNNTDNIRKPDLVFKDKLIDDEINFEEDFIYDYELKQAIEESFKNYKEFNYDKNRKENVIIKKNILPIFKTKIKRLINFDKKIKEIFEKIIPIIELYENDKINFHIVNNKYYDEMFFILKNVRIPIEEKSILETIFIKEIL